MARIWIMEQVSIHEREELAELLRSDFEPFAVAGVQKIGGIDTFVFLKKPAYVDPHDDPAS